VRLTRIRQDAVRDLLVMGHRFVSAKAKRRPTQMDADEKAADKRR
jgi:hypothetical protein